MFTVLGMHFFLWSCSWIQTESGRLAYNICDSFAPMGITWYIGHLCSSWSSKMGDIVDAFSTVVFVSPSHATLANLKYGSFLVMPTCFHYDLWPKSFWFLTVGYYHQVLLSKQEQWQCLTFFETLHDTHNQQLEEKFPYLSLLLGGTLFSVWKHPLIFISDINLLLILLK